MFIKKCSSHKKIKFLKKFKIYFCFIFFTLINSLYGLECKKSTNLKIGLVEDEHIDYEPYLYYFLGDYALHNSIDFQIESFKNNPDEFDIIFGHYDNLNKFTKIKLDLPNKIINFYNRNGVKISNNILPLDLDTLVLINKDINIQELKLQDLANYYDPIKYTLGANLNGRKMIELLIYNLETNELDLNNISLESHMMQYNGIYSNNNKNIIKSNYTEIYDSYINDENVFTLFSDGILLYKNFKFGSFQLFPKSKYFWNKNDGLFVEKKDINPISSYGFSAYLNSSNTDFICFLLSEDVRVKTFQNFNIQISPFSNKEVDSIKEKLPKKYLKILEKKKDFIINPVFDEDLEIIELLNDKLVNEIKLNLENNNRDYLN